MSRDLKLTLKDMNILYINLDRRPDRRASVEAELARLGLRGTRISAVDGKTFTQDEIDYWMSKKNFNTMTRNPDKVCAKVGCYLSHVKALKYALEHRLSPLLILEDDVKFLVDNANTEMNIPADCDMFYLGGLYWWKTNKQAMTPQQIEEIEQENELEGGEPIDLTFENIRNDNYYYNKIQILPKYFRIACTYAYILPTLKHVGGMFNSILENSKKAVDMMFVSYIQKYDNSYIINPSLCVQSDAFESDITDLGEKTPSTPYDNTYFYDALIYTIPRVQEFYKYGYSSVLQRLLKYYSMKKIAPEPEKLFKHLRWLYTEEMKKNKKINN